MDWIAVGLKEDVPPGIVIPARIDATELAVWCSPSGVYHAWSDRCPHRGMRLSHGFVRGDSLACIYHGWQYDEAGTCQYIPAHPRLTPPDTICVPTYACTEVGGVIWASLDKPDASPPDLAGRRAIRSMAIHRAAEELSAYFGSGSATIIEIGTDNDVLIAVQPCSGDHCVIHALAARTSDPKDVSRWLEDLRQTLEDRSV